MSSKSIIASKRPCVLWFTGLSGSGKSTLASAVQSRLLQDYQIQSRLLDGDELRKNLYDDLGFSNEDRSENVRRIGEAAKSLVDAGVLTIVACISPFQQDRQLVRERFNTGEFIEIFVDTPLSVCEKRDPKQLYAQAREKKITQFTGIDSVYDAPKDAEIHIHNGKQTVEDSIGQILGYLHNH